MAWDLKSIGFCFAAAGFFLYFVSFLGLVALDAAALVAAAFGAAARGAMPIQTKMKSRVTGAEPEKKTTVSAPGFGHKHHEPTKLVIRPPWNASQPLPCCEGEGRFARLARPGLRVPSRLGFRVWLGVWARGGPAARGSGKSAGMPGLRQNVCFRAQPALAQELSLAGEFALSTRCEDGQEAQDHRAGRALRLGLGRAGGAAEPGAGRGAKR